MENQHRRRVVATMHRGMSKDVILVRRFAYFDTAMPRMVQLAMNYGNEGDFVDFTADELGFHLGTLRIKKGGQWSIEMSGLAKSSPSLMKLMSNPDKAFT